MDSSIREIATHMDELSAIIDATASSVVQMTSSARETARHSEILRGATQSTAASMEVLAGSVDQVGTNAERSHELCESATEQAERGSRSVEQTIDGMEKIRQSFEGLDAIIERLADKSKSIGEVVKVINAVVEQTNLLALNAAIISSHAGEHGRAFAVVADEMRSLAERTAGSTSEIASLIDGVQSEVSQAVDAMRDGGERVGEGVVLSSQAGGILQAISESSRQTTTMVSEIVQSAATQADDIGQVRTAMAQLKEIADLLGGATREQDEASAEIRHAVERMRQLGQDVKRSTQEQSKESGIIAEAVETVSDRVQQISRAGTEQKLRSERIREALQLFRSVVAGSFDEAMDMKHTLAQLSKGAEQLDEELSRFSG
jgi:methyl-accepting chemotaxis protein